MSSLPSAATSSEMHAPGPSGGQAAPRPSTTPTSASAHELDYLLETARGCEGIFGAHPKVYDLLKKLLETGLIETSHSDWASPIAIAMKKNGVDIRLCIDCRLVNQLIKLMHYRLPLIDDLLIGFESAMWFLSLDMASGFCAVPMTLRAKLISAFICPLGDYQWTRMPFGLKNAPLNYQQMLDNCLWGFVRLPASEEAQVDPDVLRFLGIKPEGSDRVENELPVLCAELTVFRRNIPAPPQLNPVM
ncbi:hypothetical protein ON010_g4511 [Phytophthora cinnamomi]|nr:hypothetical protein ON010_g4511 [Phytophthora cinnamomi]